MENIRKLDTPITTLSRIFSSTGIADLSKKTEMCRTRKLRQISSVPQYIDESANQEPPAVNSSSNWISSESSFLPFIDCENSKSFQSCSSGYFSLSSQSAPPTCNSTSVPSEFKNVSPEPERETSENGTRFQLRRSQSCTSTWLVKRNQPRQSWPKLSGILRRSATLPVSSLQNPGNTNAEHTKRSFFTCRTVSCCPKLSPVGEDLSANVMEDSEEKSRTTTTKRSCLMSPCRLTPKKLRIASPEIEETKSPKANLSPFEDELDDTMPLEGSSLDDVKEESIEFDTRFNDEQHKGAPFDLIRRQSTPMANCELKKSSLLPKKVENKPPFQLPRCVSVPAFVDAEKFLSETDHGGVPRALPVVERTGAGLNFVSPETVANLISGKYANKNVNLMIVDCRYPYEFEGGHIRNAVNLYTPNDMIHEVFKRVPAQNPSGDSLLKHLGEGLSRRLAVFKPDLLLPKFSDHSCTEESDSLGEQDSDLLEEDPELQPQLSTSMDEKIVFEALNCRDLQSSSHDSGASSRQLQVSCEESSSTKPSFVVIFHCEFSSQRAPYLATFLRRIDRMTNYNRYPFLFFPEIYVMKGGYSEFYTKFPEYCDPVEYVTMFDPTFKSDLRLFRRLTKRVSNACQNCLHRSNDATTAGSDIKQRKSACSDPSFERPTTPQKKTQIACLFNNTFDKENTVPKQSLHWDLKVPDKLISPTIASTSERKRQTVLNVSISSGNSDSLSSNEDDAQKKLSYSSDDCSLRLAEAVIRVGRQVVAATLSHKFMLPSDEHCSKSDGSFESRPGALINSERDAPCTPICSSLSSPPLMKLSWQGSPCQETPVFARRG